MAGRSVALNELLLSVHCSRPFHDPLAGGGGAPPPVPESASELCAPEGIRTPNLQIRRHGQGALARMTRVRSFAGGGVEKPECRHRCRQLEASNSGTGTKQVTWLLGVLEQTLLLGNSTTTRIAVEIAIVPVSCVFVEPPVSVELTTFRLPRRVKPGSAGARPYSGMPTTCEYSLVKVRRCSP